MTKAQKLLQDECGRMLISHILDFKVNVVSLNLIIPNLSNDLTLISKIFNMNVYLNMFLILI